MTKEKALYQVKLILDNLNEQEYNLIPKEDINFINENMQFSEDITINPSIPLEEQQIDEKAYEYLEKIINKIEKNQQIQNQLVEKYEGYDRFELIKEIEKYKLNNEKNNEIKNLLQDYKKLVDIKNDEINKIKENNDILYNSIKKCPKLIRKFYFRNFESKLLS